MKTSLLFFLILLIAVPTVLASVTNEVNIKSSGGTSTVKINNTLGTNTNTNTYSSTTKTNVEIHQSGEGTSQVTINGKEWKLEGPGNISVSEESSPKPSSTASPSAIPSANPQELEEEQKNVITQIIKALQQLIDKLRNLF